MLYKEVQDPVPDRNGNYLWRPDIVRTGRTVHIRELSRHISMATTLTQSDIAAVLYALPDAMNMYLIEGHTVRLDGVGTFTVYGRSQGNGVLDRKEVRPSQFNSLIVKYRPEYTVSTGGVRKYVLLNEIEFVRIDHLTKQSDAE